MIDDNLTCETCCCINTDENPIIMLREDEEFTYTVEYICSICYAERLDNIDGECTS
jgi:hypothetical protein